MKKDLIKIIMNAVAKGPISPVIGACCYPSMNPGKTACRDMDQTACAAINNSTFHAGTFCKSQPFPCASSGPVPS